MNIDRENALNVFVKTGYNVDLSRFSNVEEINLHLNEATCSTAVYDVIGIIVLDNKPDKNSLVANTIEASKERVDELVNHSLKLEGLMLDECGVDHPSFDNFKLYLDFLRNESLITDSGVSETTLIGMKSSLVHHWTVASNQIQYGINDINSWDDFVSAKYGRMTRWHTHTYMQEVQSGATNVDFGVTSQILARNIKLSETPFSTHTTSYENALHIARCGYLDSEIVNFSASAVTCRQFNGKGNVTFIFRTDELLDAVPMVWGKSTAQHENEITSHFPVPIQLVRGVSPTDVFRNHKFSGGSQGTYSYQLDPEKVSM